MSLITTRLFKFLQFKVSCCLHMYFLWRHHLPPDKSENDQDSDSDWWFTYCIDIWLLTLLFGFQYVSASCFGNDNTFLIVPIELFSFSFTQPFIHSKFGLHLTLFSSVPPSHPTTPPPPQYGCRWPQSVVFSVFIRPLISGIFLNGCFSIVHLEKVDHRKIQLLGNKWTKIFYLKGRISVRNSSVQWVLDNVC